MRGGSDTPDLPAADLLAGSDTPGLATAELFSRRPRSGHERLQLRERQVAWQAGQAAVRIYPQAVGRDALEHPANSPRDQVGGLDVEVLEVEHAGAELLGAVELAPQAALGHLAVG